MNVPKHRAPALLRWQKATVDAARTFVADVGAGLLEVSHNALALVGLLVVGGLLFAAGQADLRHTLESHALGWLQTRQEARSLQDGTTVAVAMRPPEPDAVNRATAADPKELDGQQAAVAFWLARRYRVAIEPVSRLVQEAWEAGRETGIAPTLILSVMAVESSFNPFAQSPVGAQGLMQVMTKIHDDKYVAFGGRHAAFDPVTNLRVGVQVLKECITRAGSLEAGLRWYVGAANLADDGGYAAKVLAQHEILRQIVVGKSKLSPPKAEPKKAPAPGQPDIRAVAEPAVAGHCRPAARASAAGGATALRYTAAAVRLAMKAPWSRRWTTTGERGRRLHPEAPHEPFAWA